MDAHTDLSTEDDDVLEAALTMLYAEHSAATDASDGQAQAIAHYGITQILLEQSRRLDAWIEERAG